MPQFKVQIEDMAFASARPVETTLIEEAVATLNAHARAQGLFPANVSHIVGGYVTEDDHQDEDDIKCFVCVQLCVELANDAAGYALRIPTGLLEIVADALGPNLARERSWEVMGIDTVDDENAAPGLATLVSA